MANDNRDQNKKGQPHKGDAGPPAAERQKERENQPGRGSGEGVSGLQSGDGHPARPHPRAERLSSLADAR